MNAALRRPSPALGVSCRTRSPLQLGRAAAPVQVQAAERQTAAMQRLRGERASFKTTHQGGLQLDLR